MKIKNENQRLSTLEYLISAFAGVVARASCRVYRDIESLRGRNSAFEPREAERQVEGLFESLLSESFGE